MTEDPKTAGARHTPSPWHMATGPDGLITIFAGDADDPGDDDEFIAGDVDERNACLIAAAPDLLAALRVALTPRVQDRARVVSELVTDAATSVATAADLLEEKVGVMAGR